MRRFIYLDTDTLNSYIAQIYDGLVQSEKKEIHSENNVSKETKVEAGVGGEIDAKVLGKGLEGKMEAAYEHLKGTSNSDLIKDVQTKLLHDNAFDQLMDYLNKNNLLSGEKIGDFTEIKDNFYIVDLEYLKDMISDEQFLDYLKKSENERIRLILKNEQEIEKTQDNANLNMVNKKYKDLEKQQTQASDKSYDDSKDLITMICNLIPYRRIMCINNNMIVLNDKFVRDDLKMTSLKYGGEIKVVGYITNRVNNNDDGSSELNSLVQVSLGLNQIMTSFLSNQKELNIVHPIAIYYE